MPAASRRAPRRARSWAWAPRPPSSSAGASTLARFPPTACARWCGRSRHSRTSDRRPDGRRGVEPRGPLRVDLSVSLQDRQDRHARLRHRSVRDGPALAPEPVPGRGRGAHRGGRLRDPAGARAPLAPAPVRGPRVAVAPGGAAGLRRGALQRVSHRARAVRHSRDLPVLRRVRRPHHDHLPAGAPRPPPPDPDRGMTRAADRSGESEPPQPRALAGLWRAALGVVYGDIGTSPLYALKECFLPEHQLPPTPANVLGILSLIFWSLTFVISIKYVTVLLQGAQHRNRRGDHSIAVEERGPEQPEHHQRAPPPDRFFRGPDQREQGHASTLAPVVGPEEHRDVLDGDDEGEHREEQGENPEHVRRRGSKLVPREKALLEGVDRAGPNVPVDHAQHREPE